MTWDGMDAADASVGNSGRACSAPGLPGEAQGEREYVHLHDVTLADVVCLVGERAIWEEQVEQLQRKVGCEGAILVPLKQSVMMEMRMAYDGYDESLRTATSIKVTAHIHRRVCPRCQPTIQGTLSTSTPYVVLEMGYNVRHVLRMYTEEPPRPLHTSVLARQCVSCPAYRIFSP
ncbi:hypothetical protein B0H10DRAFT_2206521 [Mycena sp. CBHHK59/15]|nr:hypothetical protein B0H10DRAFT_2206521 [Mycena sp. CBHHK59/15]